MLARPVLNCPQASDLKLARHHKHIMQYRAEIDGLRALAVVPVILFHAGFTQLSGGFVGVDIFFVISGYLITSIIVSELDGHGFSLVRFYERRARRILPALFVVMGGCLVFAWMWLIPSEFADFSNSMMAVIAFSSNILFWQTSGYFETANELKPLLHTWTLSVEEQFYVLFPIFLMLAWRWGRRRVTLLAFIFVLCSLMLAQFGASVKPIATFYLLPTRGWELGLGALAAMYATRKDSVTPPAALSQLLGMLGLAMIVFSVFAFDKYTPFPSVYTLVPTVGTVLVILFAAPSTFANRILTLRPMIGIGLISYSAYLWHQPLFALARHRSFEEPGLLVMTGLAILSLALGYLSWRFVEAPFRNRERIGRKAVFVFSGIGMLLFFAIGLTGHLTDGFRERSKWKGIEATIAVQKQRASGERYCGSNAVASPLGPLVCIIGDPARQPIGVLWGDSLAGALMHGLDGELKRLGKAYYVVSSNGCIPIAGSWRVTRAEEFGCTRGRHEAFLEAFMRDSALREIVWVGAFSALLAREPNRHFVMDGRPVDRERAMTSMVRTLRQLSEGGKQVILVGETPRFRHSAADYAIWRYVDKDGEPDAMVQIVSRDETIRGLNQLDLLEAARPYASVIDGLQPFCDVERCSTHDQSGNLLFVDEVHLSHRGSEYLARHVGRAIALKSSHPRIAASAGMAPLESVR